MTKKKLKNQFTRKIYLHKLFDSFIFIQSTIATSSLFVKRLADTNKRKIRWNKNSAHPYVWRISDFDKLVTTSAFFARKFDERIDKNIINKIYNYISLEMKK